MLKMKELDDRIENIKLLLLFREKCFELGQKSNSLDHKFINRKVNFWRWNSRRKNILNLWKYPKRESNAMQYLEI